MFRLEKIYIHLILISLSLNSYSQQDENKEVENDTTESFRNFLLRSNNESQNYMFTLDLQHISNPVGKSMGTQGVSLNLGLNIGRFFSRKYILGISMELKPFGGVTPGSSPSNEFIKDFNLHFNKSFNSISDSANAYIVKDAINDIYDVNQKNFSLRKYTSFDFGIMFSPFPQKYGGLLFQLKYGTRNVELLH